MDKKGKHYRFATISIMVVLVLATAVFALSTPIFDTNANVVGLTNAENGACTFLASGNLVCPGQAEETVGACIEACRSVVTDPEDTADIVLGCVQECVVEIDNCHGNQVCDLIPEGLVCDIGDRDIRDQAAHELRFGCFFHPGSGEHELALTVCTKDAACLVA